MGSKDEAQKPPTILRSLKPEYIAFWPALYEANTLKLASCHLKRYRKRSSVVDNFVILKTDQITQIKKSKQFFYISFKNEGISFVLRKKLCTVRVMSIESIRKRILGRKTESSPNTTCYIQNSYFLCCFK